MLRRVKKADIQSDTWVRPDPIDYCLAMWGSWMATGGQRNLGARIMGGLVGESDGHGSDINEEQHSHDMQVGAATDAMIDGLSVMHRWAIYRACGVATQWRYPNADLALTLIDAREQLAVALKKNECTRNFF